MTEAVSGEQLTTTPKAKGLTSSPAATPPPGLAVAAEPPLPLRRVDAHARIPLPARHMGDARALLADVPVDAGIARAGGNRDLEPLPAAPARRHDEVAATYAPPGSLRRLLLQALIRRVPPVGHRPALIGHPGVQVSAGDAAHSDDTPVAIAVAQRALHRRGGPRFAHEGLGWRLRHKLRSCRRRGSSAPTPVRRCGGAGCAARQF